MKKQELNRKLAEYGGVDVHFNKHLRRYRWQAPDGDWDIDFTDSLDACFKWLVPKAIDRIMAEQQCSSDVAYAILFKKWLQELELIIPNAALALCLAIEKLIDGGKE